MIQIRCDRLRSGRDGSTTRRSDTACAIKNAWGSATLSCSGATIYSTPKFTFLPTIRAWCRFSRTRILITLGSQDMPSRLKSLTSQSSTYRARRTSSPTVCLERLGTGRRRTIGGERPGVDRLRNPTRSTTRSALKYKIASKKHLASMTTQARRPPRCPPRRPKRSRRLLMMTKTPPLRRK